MYVGERSGKVKDGLALGSKGEGPYCEEKLNGGKKGFDRV